MGRALILHIGYHRTGTTTLQELVFPHLAGVAYFYKDKAPAAAPIVRAFARSPEIWRRRGKDYFCQLLSVMRERGANGSALISSESMSAHNFFAPPGSRDASNRTTFRRDPFLLAAHLRECRTVAQQAGFEDLKVIIGIRRQDQYLGSLYAKAGWRAETPGQVDFERQVQEIIDPEKRYFVDGVWLDYKLTWDLAVQAIGAENVLVLPLEQLVQQPAQYLSALFAFVGVQLSPEGLAITRANSRNLNADSWQIRATAMKRAARRKAFGKFRTFLARPTQIRLPTELKAKILVTYQNSNEGLASALGIDLAPYGYCGTSRVGHPDEDIAQLN